MSNRRVGSRYTVAIHENWRTVFHGPGRLRLHFVALSCFIGAVAECGDRESDTRTIRSSNRSKVMRSREPPSELQRQDRSYTSIDHGPRVAEQAMCCKRYCLAGVSRPECQYRRREPIKAHQVHECIFLSPIVDSPVQTYMFSIRSNCDVRRSSSCEGRGMGDEGSEDWPQTVI